MHYSLMGCACRRSGVAPERNACPGKAGVDWQTQVVSRWPGIAQGGLPQCACTQSRRGRSAHPPGRYAAIGNLDATKDCRRRALLRRLARFLPHATWLDWCLIAYFVTEDMARKRAAAMLQRLARVGCRVRVRIRVSHAPETNKWSCPGNGY